jgi:predicted dehydrogenase
VTDEIRIGIVGAGYIAALHSAAYKTVAGTYPDVPRTVTLAAVADIDTDRGRDLQRRWGWQTSRTDWTEITRSPNIDVVDICVPNHQHADIAIDALKHGKHVICEKPLAHDLTSAQRMCDAVVASDRVAQVCFYYRLWPAIAHAAKLVNDGQLGTIRHFRGWMLQDYAAFPGHRLGWRSQPSVAGAGALGDLGSHILDIARHLCGDVAAVSAMTRRHLPTSDTDEALDDHVAVLAEFEDGASGVLEAGWAMRGHKLDLGFDVVGTLGALRFCWERANELEVLTDADADPAAAGTRVVVGPSHGDAYLFGGVPGQGLGYRDAFTIGIGRALSAISRDEPAVGPTFDDGLAAAQAVAAAVRSSATRSWVPLTATTDCTQP